MPAPRYEGVDVKPRFPLDIARVGGTTVLATAQRGIVRVTSSRDDGRSWAPLTVAVDALEHALPAGSDLPVRLLTLGKRVLLYGASTNRRRPGAYALLASEDGGASWQAPAVSAAMARR